jgi:hypothetical protein
MRLRILTESPLPPLKAWFSVSLEQSDTILTLKDALCSHVHALKDANVQSHNISLILDGFELLNECCIDIARDGDLIHIQSLSGKGLLEAGSQRAHHNWSMIP